MHMFKLDLEKADKLGIKLSISTASYKKQENSRKKHLLLLCWLCQSLGLCVSQQTVENSSRDGDASWENCMQVKKQQLESDMKQQTDYKLGKEYVKAVLDVHPAYLTCMQSTWLSPCLFNLYAEYIMQNAGLDEAQAGIKIAGRIIKNLRYADDTILVAESKE